MNENDLVYLSGLVHQHTGVVLDSSKAYLFEKVLAGQVREEGLASVAELVARLRRNHDLALQKRFVDSMLTHETSFFRDVQAFSNLRSTVLPALVAPRRAQRALAIWSAACSTGQEIFSVAMLIREHFPELLSWKLELIASDVSPKVLHRATRARYGGLEINRGLPISLLLRYFDQEGLEWAVHDDVRRMVRFGEINLVRPWPTLPTCDLIMLRNVLIYFDDETRRRVLEAITEKLRPGGYLMLGGAETTAWPGLQLEPTFVSGSLFFRRPSRNGG